MDNPLLASATVDKRFLDKQLYVVFGRIINISREEKKERVREKNLLVELVSYIYIRKCGHCLHGDSTIVWIVSLETRWFAGWGYLACHDRPGNKDCAKKKWKKEKKAT